MLEYIYGMTHCCLEDGQIRSSEDVWQKMRKVELLISVMHHHMKDTLQGPILFRDYSEWVK